MTTKERVMGAPNRQTVSAHTGRKPNKRLTRRYRTATEIARDEAARTFRAGFIAGFGAASLALGLFIWLVLAPLAGVR